MSKTITLSDYLAKNHITPAIESTITAIAKTGIEISKLLKKGALANILGDTNQQNIQGEQQKKLDVLANDLLLNSLINNRHCAGVASEEMEHIISVNKDGEVLVLFDPLDGSSNIDINMSVGTIFSILPYKNQGNAAKNDDFLQQGTKQLAAGYILYGTSTVLTITNGNGAAMFSYDPDIEQFILINPKLSISADTKEYAINSSNYRYWLPPMQKYINECNAGSRGKDFNMRWVATMVADVHRILIRGGVFSYPLDTKSGHKKGKLRLMYEANPISFIIEQAEGISTDAINRIMEIVPTDIHQRVPLVLGSKNEVEYIKKLHEEFN